MAGGENAGRSILADQGAMFAERRDERGRLSPEEVAKIRSKARAAAEVVLETFWDLDKFPVDPVKIARDHGAEVFWGDMVEDLDGMYLPATDESRPRILVDTEGAPTRRRFTTAHELGHLVEDGASAQTDRRRDKLSRTGTDPHEVFANEFAAALLMPEYAIKRLLGAGERKERLAKFFEVSPIAMKHRLENLGLS